MTAKEALIEARTLITPKEKWGQGRYYNPAGGRFCAVGAIDAVTGYDPDARKGAKKALREILPAKRRSHIKEFIPGMKIEWYNDTHAHVCVLEAFDTAIERAT